MPYIAYFDLMGTRGFCDNHSIYYNNMKAFSSAIKQMSIIVKDYGRVGVFSDCAYAESTDLKSLLIFLTLVQEKLMSQGLFMNGVVRNGTIGMQTISTVSPSNFYAISFESSDIANLYITQTQFKGVGIFLDTTIHDEIKKYTDVKTTNCIFIKKNSDAQGAQYVPIVYKDIAYPKVRYGNKSLAHTMEIIYNALFSSYVKSPRFAAYYISALSNMIRSYCGDFKWDLTKQEFITPSVIVKSILKMLTNYTEDISELPGIEYLALILLDEVYKSSSLNEEEKRSITKKFVGIECVKKQFIHSLYNIPQGIFTSIKGEDGKIIDNREMFIRFCQEDLSMIFVDKVMDN